MRTCRSAENFFFFFCEWKLRERVWEVSVGKEVWAGEKMNEVREEYYGQREQSEGLLRQEHAWNA